MTKKSEKRKISIIVPAYKAQKVIAQSLMNIKEVMDESGYDYEIICVVDGKVDNTWSAAARVAKKYPRLIKVVGYENNLGKGHAVRYGMAKSRGEIVGFIDAGFDIDHKGLTMLLAHFEWYKADIIVGSKRHPASRVVYPWQRRVLSYCYQLLVKILFGLKVRDTQVGLKFFRRQVLEKTLPRLLVKAWAFDIEMLSVANYLGFRRIYEAPVELKNEFGGMSVLTSKGFLTTVYGMLIDTLAIFYRLKIIHYYDSRNRKRWLVPDYLTITNSK